MASVGEILELLHIAGERARPARLTVVDWRHGPRSEAAFNRFMALRRDGGGSVAHATSARADTPAESSWTTTLALESPTRFREEAAGAQAGRRYLVRDGDRWVSWDADWGAHTSESTEERGARDATYAHLLDPNALTVALRIGPGAPTRAAGRTAWRVTATPRDEDESATGALFRVGPGAEQIELTIDAERGALLRSEACLGGEPFHRLEVTEIEYGALPADSFALELPPGVEPAGDPFVPRWLPLHEVQAEVPFVVFAPARLPESWRLQGSLLVPGRGQPPIEPEVSLMYASGNGAYTVTLRERAATAERDDWLEWTSDGELDAADAGEHVEPRHHARVERAGTLVELSGSDAILLAQLVRALAPAPTRPPRLENE